MNAGFGFVLVPTVQLLKRGCKRKSSRRQRGLVMVRRKGDGIRVCFLIGGKEMLGAARRRRKFAFQVASLWLYFCAKLFFRMSMSVIDGMSVFVCKMRNTAVGAGARTLFPKTLFSPRKTADAAVDERQLLLKLFKELALLGKVFSVLILVAASIIIVSIARVRKMWIEELVFTFDGTRFARCNVAFLSFLLTQLFCFGACRLN